ncbi:hypothetical protein D9M69_639150 [compost metagenome]
MQGRGVQALALQRTRQTRATQLAVDEHEGLLEAALAQDLLERVALVVVVDAVEMLLDRRSGGVGARDLDGHRVLQVAVGQALDLG